MKKRLLYISAVLPARSETFVYRELFALESLGVDIQPVSVHEPGKNLGSEKLEQLGKSVIEIYSSGLFRILIDALYIIIKMPKKSFSVLSTAIFDIFHVSDIRGLKRGKIIFQAIASLALANRVKNLNIEHIHAHMANVPTTIAMYTAKQLGVGFSFTGHANDIFPNRVLLKEKLERSLFVSCISNWHRTFYKSINNRDDLCYPVIRCGIDTKTIAYEAHKHDTPLRVLGVGRLVRKKGFDILIDAVNILKNKHNIDLEVIIAGTGAEEENLKKQIEALPDNIDIRMLGDTDNEKVFELLGENDIFVLPVRVSRTGDRDGIPVVLMEAMAKGCCVISGDLVTIRELIDDKVSGFLVKSENVDNLVERIKELNSKRNLIDELSLEARKKIELEFDLTVNAERIIKTMKNFDLEF